MSFLSFKRNVELGPPLEATPWRKVAIGTWSTVGDPSVYGMLELDARAAMAYIKSQHEKTGQRVTISHFVGKAIAETIKRHPDINCILRFGRLYPRKSVDIFFQVATDPEGKDLSGVTLRQADQKSMVQLAKEMAERVEAIRSYKDQTFTKMKNLTGLLPGFLVGTLLKLTGFLFYTLNLWSPVFGTPRDPFGSIMITNIGSLGLDFVFGPLVPYNRIPVLIVVGEIKDTPVVQNSEVKAIPTLRLSVTFDHRLIDGMHGSKMSKTLKKIFENPDLELGA